ncbi:peptidylprolyl isomerase [Sphingobacterium psychroaquaticum]|uniref:peptidylprolyl isomerase n=1 Tax=Sphingobacterium psychroaquaticum TaxID=561061 RepID=UPI00106BEBC8|nr:peptidylprolyl isomerase [Sphingobacterium psychroaquaticum]QBQ41037.1 peptidylprolyl isomerase [Sphingobacterium psychroaquaticum]
MKKILLLLTLFICTIGLQAQTYRLSFETPYGVFKVQLYDYTPQHRDLILNAIKTDVYKDALFNRVIKNFVVQGGEHDIDIEKREAADPAQGKPRLAPEFDARAFHKMGVLGAGRDNNPSKSSFLNQIYFVVGKPVTEQELNELSRKKNHEFTAEQRAEYLKNGGLPRLDGDYTVFGEVYEGFDVLLKISGVTTDKLDYPVEKIPFKLQIIKDEAK